MPLDWGNCDTPKNPSDTFPPRPRDIASFFSHSPSLSVFPPFALYLPPLLFPSFSSLPFPLFLLLSLSFRTLAVSLSVGLSLSLTFPLLFWHSHFRALFPLSLLFPSFFNVFFIIFLLFPICQLLFLAFEMPSFLIPPPSLSLFLPIFFLCLCAFGSARTLRRNRQEATTDHLHQRENTDYSSGVFVDAVPITSTGNGKALSESTRRHLSEKLRQFSDDLWWFEMDFAQRN